MQTLQELFDKYECDKGTDKHHYYKEYEPYFENKRNEPVNILEIGTLAGASTAAFSEYFGDKGTVYTIDTFERIHPRDIPILEKDSVKWLKGNSMDASLPNIIKNAWGKNIKFDFIIDDGAHYPEANRLTFDNCYPFLKKDGTYFIEDFYPMHIMTQQELGHYWLQKHPDRFNMLKHNRFMNDLDNYNYVCYDRRKETGNLDTFVVAVTK